MTAIKWVLVCGILNSMAITSVIGMAVFTDIPIVTSLAIGAMFVLASGWPYSKAQKAYAAEQASA